MDIASTPTKIKVDFERRKAKQLEVCLDRADVETGDTLFGDVHFIHQALSELDLKTIDTTTDFLGFPLALPLFISCMTGGTAVGKRANRELAMAAQALRIPLGLGSISILFSDEDAFDDFHVKPLARDVPVIANIGAVRLRDTPFGLVEALLDRLEVQALAVHLNPAQELFQEDGDRDFRGAFDAIRRFAEKSKYPVVVKETGFGISPSLVSLLLEAGVSYVDVAGAGGTNWAMVESLRGGSERSPGIDPYLDWGIPTALILAALRKVPPSGGASRILASGGVRDASHVAKSIALGAALAGMALPLIRTVVAEGQAGVVEFVHRLHRDLRALMLLVGAGNVAELAKRPVWFSASFQAALESFSQAEGGRS
jgi:isopentenyl-diphosphate delta-isomerase type 2